MKSDPNLGQDVEILTSQLAELESDVQHYQSLLGCQIQLASSLSCRFGTRSCVAEHPLEPAWGNVAHIAHRVRQWRLKNFGEQTRARNALQICEEAGEVARAVGKADEGIRPETRGNLADELGDVILATCGMAAAEGIDLVEVVKRRLARMESLDFTKGPEGV